MNQLTTQSHYWTLATNKEKAAALAGLSELNKRAAGNLEAEKHGYLIALDGVTSYGLQEAVNRIFKGALGHGFMPSPPELRILIDSIMKPIAAMKRYDDERKRIHDEMQADKVRPVLSDEQRERMNKLWAETKGKNENSEDNPASRLEALAATNGKTVDWSKIDDQKKTGTWQKLK